MKNICYLNTPDRQLFDTQAILVFFYLNINSFPL